MTIDFFPIISKGWDFFYWYKITSSLKSERCKVPAKKYCEGLCNADKVSKDACFPSAGNRSHLSDTSTGIAAQKYRDALNKYTRYNNGMRKGDVSLSQYNQCADNVRHECSIISESVEHDSGSSQNDKVCAEDIIHLFSYQPIYYDVMIEAPQVCLFSFKNIKSTYAVFILDALHKQPCIHAVRRGDCRGDCSGDCRGDCRGNCRGNCRGDCRIDPGIYSSTDPGFGYSADQSVELSLDLSSVLSPAYSPCTALDPSIVHSPDAALEPALMRTPMSRATQIPAPGYYQRNHSKTFSVAAYLPNLDKMTMNSTTQDCDFSAMDELATHNACSYLPGMGKKNESAQLDQQLAFVQSYFHCIVFSVSVLDVSDTRATFSSGDFFCSDKREYTKDSLNKPFESTIFACYQKQCVPLLPNAYSVHTLRHVDPVKLGQVVLNTRLHYANTLYWRLAP